MIISLYVKSDGRNHAKANDYRCDLHIGKEAFALDFLEQILAVDSENLLSSRCSSFKIVRPMEDFTRVIDLMKAEAHIES